MAGTTLTVKAVDTAGGVAWIDDDYIILGEIGSKTAEILQLNGVVSDGTSLIIDQSGSGGTRFAHSVDEPVYRIDFNQIEFSRATTASGTKTVLATQEIQPDDLFTRYEDSANSTGFGFVRWKNGSSFSEYSAAIPYTGYTKKSLGRMIKMIRRHLDEPDFRDLTDQMIIEELNEKQRDIAHERLWPFYEDIFSDSLIANQNKYTIDSDVVDGKVHTVVLRTDPLAKMDRQRFNMLQWDTSTVGDPTHCHVWQNQLVLWPVRDTAAATDTLDGDVTASALTIMVDDNSVFAPSGRIIVNSEVISYTGQNTNTTLDGAHTAAVTTITVSDASAFPSTGTITIGSEEITYTGTTGTTFTGATRGANSTTAAAHNDGDPVSAKTLIGCLRGLEGTTAAAHSDADAVTERDLVYTAHREPDELADYDDTTNIPDPLVLTYGTAMELALGKLHNQGMHDRMQLKYDQNMARLRDKFGRKMTSGYYKIKDKGDVVSDEGRFVDQNLFPTQIGQ